MERAEENENREDLFQQNDEIPVIKKDIKN